jgi:hypothetical protein
MEVRNKGIFKIALTGDSNSAPSPKKCYAFLGPKNPVLGKCLALPDFLVCRNINV